ncbi:UNVERIFIED_CONTAM: hypothetical protein PYX00_010490 [Menopon gallinae]
MYIVLIHHYMSTYNILETYQERMLVIICMACGLVLIYGDFIPYLLTVFMRVSLSQGEYYEKYLQLQRYLVNINVSPELTEQIQKYFRYFWNSGTTSIEMKELMQGLPLALKKQIFTDIYWEAFRHSDVFKPVSRCCKRSLSLHMKTQYCQEGEIIFAKNKVKPAMIYLVHGIMELMAEENENSPIMSFSSGTVLGEMSIFMLVKSLGIVKCRTICEIQTLSLRDAFRVMGDYPKDKNVIFQTLNKRIVVAKITQWRKRQINIEKMVGQGVSGGIEAQEDCVKWVKMQWRGIWEAHERHLLVTKAIEDGLRVPAWRKQYEVHIRLDMISNYMDLMVLSDMLEEKKDVVCLKTSFPWSIDPKAQFLKLWKVLVLACAVFASIAYPFCTAWMPEFPTSIFTGSCVVTFAFEADLILLTMTAVKTKHGILTKYLSVLLHLLKKPTFYLDIIAAIPVQLFLILSEDSYQKKYIGAFLLTACLKSHVFIKPRTSMTEGMVFVSLVKNTFLLSLMLFWFSAFFQLVLVNCRPNCFLFEWRTQDDRYDEHFVFENLISVFVALSLAISLPDSVIVSDDTMYYVGYIVVTLIFFFWSAFMVGDFYTVYSFTISNRLRFKVLYTRVLRYLESIAISSLVERRILRLVRFQWVYNRADDLLTKVPIIYLAPLSLRRQVYKDTLFQTLKRCPMFVMESNDFIFDLIDKCNLVAVPAGTVLVDYGLKCYRIYLLHKGYCQVNSFLKNDISGGLGAPILLKPGHLFPTLAAFATIPAPVSIITLTDCEVVVVDLEDMLKTMVTHEMFHDIASVLLENNYIEKLSDHTLAMVRVNVQYNKPPNQERAYNVPFKKLGNIGFILKRMLFYKPIFFDENQRPTRFLRIVDFCYILYLTVNAILWPLAFGLLTLVYKSTILFLLSLNVLYLVYFYIQLHIPYFDHRGLLITHPLYTMLHYLTTSFPFDFFFNFPIYLVYNVTISNFEEQDSEVLVFCVILQKLIAIVYINQYVDDKIRDSNYVFLLGPVKFFGILLIIMNAFANIMMFASVDWVFDGPLNIIFFDEKAEGNIICGEAEVTDPIMFYITITHWMLSRFTANYILCFIDRPSQIIHANICSFVGYICTLAFYGWLASHSGVGDSSATLYQERMKSFLYFLRSSKTEDKAVENAVGYFEHQWAKTRGQNLLEICDNVPSHLLEELAYPLYRRTLSKITPFQNADESFFRLLSIHLELVHYNRGSIVLFKGQVQDDIFFIHRGKCFAYDWFVTLEMGSVIGDIKRTGVIDNKIYALTHVELLRIKSAEFYTILNNFYEIESSFKHLAETTENFIKTPYVTQNIQLRPVDSRDILNAFNLRSRELGFEDQSYFEDPENIATRSHIQTKQRVARKRFAFIIYPGTLPMVIYKIMITCVAFLTVVTMPPLLFYASLTVEAFSIIATLDILWFLLTLTAFRIGVVDKVKGDVVTNYKVIMKLYLVQLDGFFLSLIACLPFEVIAIILADGLNAVNPKVVGWLRAPRFIRGYYLIRFLNAEVSKLKVSSAVNYLAMGIYIIIFHHVIVLFYLMIGTSPEVISTMDPHRLGWDQIVSLLIVHENSLSLITSAKVSLTLYGTVGEILYFNIVVLVSIYARGLIIRNVLSIRYVYNVARGKYKSQVSRLETCLKRHQLSLSIQKEVLDYKLNILIATRSENMPMFLLHSPDAIKLGIMTDLYLSRLTNSPIFKAVGSKFLKLLSCRMKRAYYFPRQKIVEKGDVDYTMYFINKGEVYIVDQTEGDAYVEYVVNHMYSGEEFGQLQGVAIAFPHKNTYIARTVVEMITLCSKDWFDLRQAYQDEFHVIIENARKLY